MKNYFLIKQNRFFIKEYIFIFLTATIFLLTTLTKSFSDEDVFIINSIEVDGKVDLNFSRSKYIDKAFVNSFEVLMTKILLSRDLSKVSNVKLEEIKKLIDSFQILEERYSKNKYTVSFKIFYNEINVKKFLAKKDISFSLPENISAVFYPIFFINGEIKNFDENYFYKEWKKVIIKNEIINFILPVEDLDDISKITKMKNKIEELDIGELVSKYDIKNYVFALIDYKNNNLNIYLKTNFNNNLTSNNFSYRTKKINDQVELNSILVDLKLKISEIWKEENLINLLLPLSINVKYEHIKIENLEKLRKILNNINMIDQYVLEKFDIKSSFFKIYYYGNPKKLKTELFKFGYQLKNNQGSWQLYLND